MAKARLLPALALALAALLPPAATWIGQPDLVTTATQIAIYAIAAAGLDLLIGVTGLSSFGHAAFFGLGGYTVGILAYHAAEGPMFGLIPGATQAWIVWPLAVAIAALAAAAIGALSLRTRGVSFIMITLAFAEMFYFLFVSLKTYGGDDGLGFRTRNALPFIAPRDDNAFYEVCLFALALVLLLFGRLRASRFGRVLHAIRQNPRRVAALGLDAARYQLAVFVIAGAAAGFAGALQANLLRFVSPDMLHWSLSGDFMIMVVLGGAGTLFGPVAGAAALVLLQNLLAQWTEHWMIVMGPVLVLVVLFARRGLWGLVAR